MFIFAAVCHMDDCLNQFRTIEEYSPAIPPHDELQSRDVILWLRLELLKNCRLANINKRVPNASWCLGY
jgi:hypothetical protein